MFTFTPLEAVQVTSPSEPTSDPVQLAVTKVHGQSYFAATKGNKALTKIMMFGMGKEDKNEFRTKRSCTDVLEQIKTLKDNKYKELVSNSPAPKRSRSFKSFVLQLPDTVVIDAPEFCEDVGGCQLRVILSNLTSNQYLINYFTPCYDVHVSKLFVG